MGVDYDLTRLGAAEFEHLCQALYLRLLGRHVSVFGDGPDGGREATYTGRSQWTIGAEQEVWDGYQVLQAKFRARPLGTSADQQWFSQQVRNELATWRNPDSRRSKLGRRPEYLVLTTNVTLSATEGGGVDTIEDLLADFAANHGLKGWCVWHYDQICSYLDDAPAIRHAYAGLLTSGDVLSKLYEVLQGGAIDLGEAMKAHVAKDLLLERWVRLGQSGAEGNDRHTLDQVAVDLPAQRVERGYVEKIWAIAHLLAHGDRVLRRSVLAAESNVPHVVLVGGPGQGKTTLGQLLAQIYRVALLESDADRFGRETATTVAAIQNNLREQEIPIPNNLRWPIRVDLASYAETVSGGQQTSLVRWLAQQITGRGATNLTGSDLSTWLRSWPWLLVLDGLDEVTSPHAREHLFQCISEFLVDASREDADLFVVVTTRPQGYGNELSVEDFDQLTLRPLGRERALSYARRLASVRHHGDEEMRIQTLDRVDQATLEPLTARLMVTPLQVTIMFLLLERRSRAPQDRHGLFDAYYDTIYAREAGKPGSLGQLLDQHRQDVNALHEQVGLRLQVLAETEVDLDASLPQTELHSFAVDRLVAEGHDSVAAQSLAEQIVAAATDRLVLLVPKGTDEVGFEVRSLQEYMSARAMVTGPDNHVLDRLRVAAPAVHWRNTWLLAAGRVFATREHLRGPLLGLLREIDARSALTAVIPAGPELAIDLLADDVAARTPHFRRQLLAHALEILRLPPNSIDDRLAWLLHDLARTPDLRTTIVHKLERGLVAPPLEQATALTVLTGLDKNEGALTTKARQLLHKTTVTPIQEQLLAAWNFQPGDGERHPQPVDSQHRQLGGAFATALSSYELTGNDLKPARNLLRTLGRTTVVTLGPDHQICVPLKKDVTSEVNGITARTLADGSTQLMEALALALQEIPSENWVEIALITAHLETNLRWLPVGQQVTAI